MVCIYTLVIPGNLAGDCLALTVGNSIWKQCMLLVIQPEIDVVMTMVADCSRLVFVYCGWTTSGYWCGVPGYCDWSNKY